MTADRLGFFGSMTLMRRFEEAVGEGAASGEIHGEMHLSLGQEAIAAGLAPHLRHGDAIVSTHRPHLHALALGVDPVDLLAELFERDGLCRGKGGHMHLFDPGRSFMCTGIVGASAPIATGYAFARRTAARGDLAIAVTGDGGMNQGAVLESMNLAALWKLPLIFLCEDNGYGISVPRSAATAGELVDRAAAFGMPGHSCDGTDPALVHDTLAQPVRRARAGEGPSLVIATAYRYSGHYEGDADTYRTRAEKEDAMSDARDPIARLRAALLAQGTPAGELERAEERAAADVRQWLAAAHAKPQPRVDQVLEDVFA